VKFIGVPIKRLEDPRLLVGGGRYVDDLIRPGMAHAVIVRSPHAHARVLRIDGRRARARPGVLGFVTAADLTGVPVIPLRQPGKPAHAAYLQPPLAGDTVRYVGQPIAVVVATDRAAAVDARDLVDVEYDVLPARIELADADSVALFAEGNEADSWTTTFGDVDAVLPRAAFVVSEQFSVGRQTAAPMETRGLLAEWEADAERLTVWGETKVPYFNRRTLASMLGIDEARIDFAEADVGGGFGARGEFYPEDFLIPFLARRLGRPVKWVEDRREHFLTINHSREQQWSVVAAADERGRLLALDASFVNVMGGYLRTHGIWAASLTASYLPGPYQWPNYRCRVSGVMTTKTPTGTVRAPGFYEGAFVRERILDVLAARAGLDPAEIRRRNLARPGDQPYTVNTVAGAVMGRQADFADEDFGAMFEHALKVGRYEARRAECRERNAAGGDVRYGVGLAAVVETSGTGPFESAKVILTPEGRIALAAGATSLGQGLPTTLAQVCAEVLQVPVEHITVHLGDTRWMPNGVGSSASRSAVMAGSAVHHASTRLREQIAAIAAARFEASPADIELAEGAAFVRGVPDRRCSLREIAALAASPLESEWRHEATRAIGSFGFHLSVVGVDVTTGEVHPETHFVLCDVGRALNPAIVEGQLVGAVIQGIGHATMEELVYDSSGQLLTGTFMDYAMPTAAKVPAVELVIHESAAASNPLGVKGAGEAGTSGVGAAVANAVAAAVGSAAARHVPVTAPRVRAAIHVLLLLLALLLAACSAATAPVEPIDGALLEEIHRVDVPAAKTSIVVTSFRPRARGPLPWIVMSHGTATTPEANRAIGRIRFVNPTREWIRRGYAVIVPVRRGYGATGGAQFGDSYGGCSRPDFRRAGEGAALDILATIQWAKTQRDLDPNRWLLVGQSSGGFASIYTASKRPEGLVAVLAFAPGRGGRPDTHPGLPCAPDPLAKLFASIAPDIAVPVLWFYAENDQYVGPAAAKLWFESFQAAGGRGDFVMLAPFPQNRSHGVYPSSAGTPLWTAAVATFFHAHQIALPF